MATPPVVPSSESGQNASAATDTAELELRNRILKLLPACDLEAVLACSEIVEVKSKELIFERSKPIPYVYYPENCVISLVTLMEDGSGVEAMTIGNDGFAGIGVFNRVGSSYALGCGQISGIARRISAVDFTKLLDESPQLDRLMHRYSQLVFETVSQSAACNRLHVIEQRCARWLLMSQDRVGRARFDLTQEFLAEMLGVRRPGVTVAMGILEKNGLIAHGRGSITVVDRPGLERASCECYRTIKARQERLIG